MARVPIPIVAGHDAAASRFVSSRTLVNCFVETVMGRPALYGGPGYSARQTLATGPVRGLHPFGDDLIAVGGNRLYTVTEGGTATDRGQILGASAVSMDDNGLEVVIVAEDAEKSYAWDGSTLAEITDADLSALSSVTFIDQYMVGSIKNTGRFQISALADATSWDALDVATAETRPDNLRRVVTDNRDLLLFGEKTIEGQYNSGDADFPFSRSQLFFECGLAGRDCLAPVDNTVAFLAVDKGGGFTVRIIRGGTAVIISTPAIAHLISQWADPGAAKAFSYSLRNHQFWVLRHADGCVVWDASAAPDDAWHVRKSYGSETWAPAYAAHIWNTVILGAADTGALYTLDMDTYAEAGEPLVRYVQTEPLGPGQYFTLNEVELLVEPGVGLLSGQGSDPEVWMELSRNGGKTWGSRMTRKLGQRGEYEKRIVWDGGFGQFRPEGGVVRFGISDPVSLAIKGAFADFTVDG
jgi:hypothetical protein